MVIPSSFQKSSAGTASHLGERHSTNSALQQTTKSIVNQTTNVPQQQAHQQHTESREGGQHEETWFTYFFGPSAEEIKQQQAQERERTSSTSMETREAATETRDATNHSQPPQVSKQEESQYPSWLSWMDPNSVAQPCSSSNHHHDHPAAMKTMQQTEQMSEQQQQATHYSSTSTAPKLHLPNMADDDKTDAGSVASSVDESKIFRDLDSVCSTRVGTIAGSVRAADLDLPDDMSAGSISESVVGNKIASFKMPQAKEVERSDSFDSATKKRLEKLDSVKSLEARRQLLVTELRSTINTHGRYDVKTANISSALGGLLEESKQYEQAIKLYRDAVEIYSSKLGDDHDSTMDAKIQLAKALQNGNKLDEAINVFFLVTSMRKAIHGESSPSAADSLVLMAHALRKKDDFQQAIKELKRALKVYREALGDAHEKVSSTVDEIASLYVTIGDFEKSAAILEEVVKLKAVTNGMQSQSVATTLCNLATTYECSEDFTKAMKSLKKAYKIYTEMDGYSSNDSTNTLNRIAQLYEATGDNDRAAIAYLGVLRGRKVIYGDDHLQVAETYFKLGRSLRESGQHEKALKCLKEGLPIYVNKGVEINDVEMIAEVMHEMALINKERKRFNEASRIFKQELGVRRKIGQSEYPMIARTLNHLGVTEYEMKNYNKSLKFLVEALTIFRNRAEGSVECAEVLFNTGLVFESSRNRERAVEAYEEASRIFRNHGYKDTHPHLAKATRKLVKLRSGKLRH